MAGLHFFFFTTFPCLREAFPALGHTWNCTSCHPVGGSEQYFQIGKMLSLKSGLPGIICPPYGQEVWDAEVCPLLWKSCISILGSPQNVLIMASPWIFRVFPPLLDTCFPKASNVLSTSYSSCPIWWFSVIFWKNSNRFLVSLGYNMTEIGRVNIIPGQNSECILWPVLLWKRIFLILLPDMDGKHHIQQIGAWLPCI